MARPINESLEYFPLDVDFFDQPKLLLVEEDHGMAGGYIAIRLYCWIYSQGYYIKWESGMDAVFAKRIGHQVTSEIVKTVLNSMLHRGMLSRERFEQFGILTSRGIQKRWRGIVQHAKRKAEIDPRFNLLTTDSSIENEGIDSITPIISAEETNPIPEETNPIPEESTQSKVKESKVKKSKEKDDTKVSFSATDFDLSFFSDSVKNLWIDFFDQRQDRVGKPGSKTKKITERAAKIILNRLKNEGEVFAKSMLERAIVGGWDDVYELKPWEKEKLGKGVVERQKQTAGEFEPDGEAQARLKYIFYDLYAPQVWIEYKKRSEVFKSNTMTKGAMRYPDELSVYHVSSGLSNEVKEETQQVNPPHPTPYPGTRNYLNIPREETIKPPFESAEGLALWSQWLQHLNASGKNITPLMLEKQVEELASKSEKIAMKMINNSIMGGHTSVYPLRQAEIDEIAREYEPADESEKRLMGGKYYVYAPEVWHEFKKRAKYCSEVGRGYGVDRYPEEISIYHESNDGSAIAIKPDVPKVRAPKIPERLKSEYV
jgi:hypothetical protein